ncbi:3-hydroxyisobutyrate dehydrogenase [Lasallia pustulata]|uniref:3-hydroxyisobutyrate dehydrogenase n=1 Tax=Lasallia pustulata TaxID=136370 RepID=A0A1W5D8T2_9LECA|nr:3-hydroxyisobutyrate dehydrogenase [Lasallia pustulata]
MTAAISVRFLPSRLCLLGNGSVASACSRPARRSFATREQRQATWGFIGLGRMGFPMARNLRAKLSQGDSLVIHDVNQEATAKFVEEVGPGVEVMETPRQVAEISETIITVLPEPSHVKNVFYSILKPPTLATTKIERLFIDCSTIDPTSSRDVANAVHSTRLGRFVDAPMSGGVVGAQAGTLTFMLGASSRSGQLVERAKPILALMGGRVLHLGEQGAGLSGKLANNYLLAVSNIATAEAMNLGIKLGLDPKVLGDLINSSSGRCWASEVNNPVPGVVGGAPAGEGYEGGFGVSLMRKDLKLAIEAAAEAGAKLELGQRAAQVYDEVAEAEKGKDFSVVYRWLGGKV